MLNPHVYVISHAKRNTIFHLNDWISFPLSKGVGDYILLVSLEGVT